MNLFDTLRISIRAIARNGLRSFLTALGIIIGVAAVIAMVAIGEGARSKVEEAFAAMGTNLLIVIPGANVSSGARGGFGSQPTLTYGDLKSIQQEIPGVAAAAPVSRTNAQLQSEELNWSTSVQGTTVDFFTIRNWKVARGNPMSQGDNDSGSKVVLLGQTTAQNLFPPGEDPVGKLIRIRGVPFQIIGVLAPKGQSPNGQDYDDVALMPDRTFRTRIQPAMGDRIGGIIMVSARAGASTQRVQQQITDLLRDRHRLARGMEDDFSIRNLAEVASAQQQGAQTLSLLLASIAAVSLLVGGIGIMNIMLVSVTERTREIGVRMAVGATPQQVMSQFLVESLTLSLVGGLLGMGLGVFIARQLSLRFQWPLQLDPQVALLAAGFSALVGICFGLYPALKASRLDPIVALRFE